MARRVFGEAALPRAERDTQANARRLIRQNPVPDIVNARDLRRMAYGPGIRDADQVSAALEELADAGWVRRASGRAGGYGRQRLDWAVNPALGTGASSALYVPPRRRWVPPRTGRGAG
jgi:hypothetical protein